MIRPSSQFSLVALFVFTTVTAVSFAMLRLPIGFGLKIVIMLIIVVSYCRWIMGRHAHQQFAGMPVLILSAGGILYVLWLYISSGKHPLSATDHVLGLCLAVFLLSATIAIVNLTIAKRYQSRFDNRERNRLR
jgi:hypothetical protein